MNILAKGASDTVRFGQSGRNSHYHIKPGACLTVYGVGNSFGEIHIEPVGDEGAVEVRVVQPIGREFPISHQIEFAVPAAAETGSPPEPKVGEPLSGEWPVSLPDYLQPDPWPPEITDGPSQIAQPHTHSTRPAQEIEQELFAGTRPSALPKADTGQTAHARATD